MDVRPNDGVLRNTEPLGDTSFGVGSNPGLGNISSVVLTEDGAYEFRYVSFSSSLARALAALLIKHADIADSWDTSPHGQLAK